MFEYMLFIVTLHYVSHAKPMDYDPIFERLEFVYYNKNVAKTKPQVVVKKFNRTNFALDMKLDLLQDLDGKNLESLNKVFVLSSNVYKFTGINIRTTPCQLWNDNLFGIASTLKVHGNLDFCNLRKGLKVVKNFWADTSYFPATVPHYSYRIEFHVEFRNGTKLSQMDLYGKAVPIF